MDKKLAWMPRTFNPMPAALDRRPVASRLRDRAIDLVGLMTTPLLPADYLDLVSPLRVGADLRGRIVEIHPETRDAVTLGDPARTRLGRARREASTSGSASTSTACASGARTR